ncbi:MAG TPA: hypothetical protein PKM43_18085 [Verrucomicrobiota bacterium]|nr:hypothetical protein [Verrucomicrobiota bacterium]
MNLEMRDVLTIDDGAFEVHGQNSRFGHDGLAESAALCNNSFG